MTEAINPEIFQHLVGLAALELDSGEAEYLRRELNSQLTAIRELEAIELDASTPIASHGVPYTPEISQPPREDRAQSSGLADDILAQVPETQGRFIVVPDIPHTELE